MERLENIRKTIKDTLVLKESTLITGFVLLLLLLLAHCEGNLH